ncbi:MAG: hypothetical protein ICV60_01085 [Pyrinomonadaceae bacterium]|nr:hypothetical protein [Pyrinomonadaceae bacterium]
MSDYKDKLDEWQRAARRKARELDEKYGIKDRLEDAADVAQGAARKGAERARTEAERLSEEFEVKERAKRAAEEAARRAREAGETFKAAAGTAGEKAEEVFDAAKKYYERGAQVFDLGARVTRAGAAATTGALRAGGWVRENPGKAALTTFSLVLGVRMGASFPGLDAVLIGSHPHWFTHSALPVYGLRKASQKFDEYLKRQESLIASGELKEAESSRVEFERKVVKYVGAPLLGAFSCAAGAALWAQIFQPGRITGAPISWLLGGNPFLDGIWLFANGVICFHQGYKFFMIALADDKQVQKLVREIKGLLPAASASPS